MRLVPKSKYSHIVTLGGMSLEEVKAFSYNNLRHFFRVSLWDRSHICAGCHKEINNIREATLDHIVPKYYGGRTRLSNLQLVHEKCNTTKKTKLPKVVSSRAFIPVTSHLDFPRKQKAHPLPPDTMIV